MQKLVTDVELMIEERHPEANNAVQYWTSHKYGALLLTEDKDGASITAFNDKGNVIAENLYSDQTAAGVQDLLVHVFAAKHEDYAAITDEYSVNKRDFNKLWAKN
ncbi:hypothetical protein [Lacticaseibacillus paracasei]|uniref:hypothetical protein n=1 Tax=Lacticaseibacillus paracasei TaxID=1597 RepID=UPI0036D32F0B